MSKNAVPLTTQCASALAALVTHASVSAANGASRTRHRHMKKAVDDGVDLSAAVKSFNAKPFSNLKHADVWIPQLANQTYLEMERE
jgi:hypothetical protein